MDEIRKLILFFSMFKYKLILIIVLFCKSIFSYSQTILSPTFSSFSIESKNSNKLMQGTSGETVTGVRNSKGYVIIEGFYAIFDFIYSETPEIKSADCLIYPNPAKDYFYISNEKNNVDVNVKIYTNNGILIKAIPIHPYSKAIINGLESGIYLILHEGIERNNNISGFSKLIVSKP